MLHKSDFCSEKNKNYHLVTVALLGHFELGFISHAGEVIWPVTDPKSCPLTLSYLLYYPILSTTLLLKHETMCFS